MLTLPTVLFSTFVIAIPLINRQIENDAVPGSPTPPNNSTGQTCPSVSLVGPAASIRTINSNFPGATLAPESYQLAPNQNDTAAEGLIINLDNVEHPQQIRGNTGDVGPGPSIPECVRLSPDLFAGPSSDMGNAPNAK